MAKQTLVRDKRNRKSNFNAQKWILQMMWVRFAISLEGQIKLSGDQEGNILSDLHNKTSNIQ